ncbi:MAG: RraA family protein [Chloroflexota bacterium]|nr:RraA family protein [Chloroflexota bacterium]
MPASGLAELRLVLRSALVADALDALGQRQQCLPSDIRPLPPAGVLVGFAATCRTRPHDTGLGDPYAGLRRVLASLTADDVLVIATERSNDYAVWGELVSIVASTAGAVGTVTDGLVRDLEQLERLGYRTFARGTTPIDVGHRADYVGFGEPVQIDGVAIRRGDLIVGDIDGTVIVPGEMVSQVV